jgi:N-acetylglutamate synthase-like GNAT family acetyltransferase
MTADYDRAVVEHIIDLWEEGGQLLALIEMIPSADHLLIENIAVRPDCQGRGVGDGLLHHAEGLAHSLGFDEVQLYTNAAFASNLAFYSRRGYEEYRRATIVPGSVTVHMRKRIEASGNTNG